MKEPNWEAMCKALYWTVENGSGYDLEEVMRYITKYIEVEDDEA